VSAFKGDNWTAQSALGAFLRAAKEGKLAPRPVLVVESLDRFSRQSLSKVLPVWIDLLNCGVELYSCQTGRLYERKSADDLPALIEALVTFSRANEESALKSERVKAALASNEARAKRGEPVHLQQCPSYYELTSQGYVVREPQASTVQRMFRSYAQGETLKSIVRRFNRDQTPCFRRHTKHWSDRTIRQILASRYPLGEYKGQAGYFPRLVSDADWNKVQVLLRRNVTRRGTVPQQVNLLRGLVRCSVCGNGVTLHQSQGHSYYRCCFTSRGTCTVRRMVPRSLLEQDVLLRLLATSPADYLRQHDRRALADVEALQGQVARCDESLGRLAQAIATAGDVDELTRELVRVRGERASVQASLAAKQQALNVTGQAPKAHAALQAALAASGATRLGFLPGKDFKGSVGQYVRAGLELRKRLAQDLQEEALRKRLVPLLQTLVGQLTLDLDGRVYQLTGTAGQVLVRKAHLDWLE
jgi:DNA invertase Pin-like site-specific DNA recombinase